MFHAAGSLCKESDFTRSRHDSCFKLRVDSLSLTVRLRLCSCTPRLRQEVRVLPMRSRIDRIWMSRVEAAEFTRAI